MRSSIARALDGLTQGELSVLDALVVARQTTDAELVARVAAGSGYVAATLGRLRGLALAWDSPEGLRALSGVADALGPRAVADADRPVDAVPALTGEHRSPRLSMSAALGAAGDFVRRTEMLLDGWSRQPAGALRTAGLGVRELRATAAQLQVSEQNAAVLVEVAAEAGLLDSRADRGGNQVWVPTDDFDTWRELAPAEQWTALARAWLGSARLPSMVGRRGPDKKPWNVLTPELHSPEMAEAKAMALAALADLPTEHGLASGTGLPALVALLEWQRPRRSRTRAELVAWAVAEAALLGITGAEVLSPYGRVLAAGDDPAPALAALLPAPVDHVLVQADLTAVAPGPLEPALARQMDQVADLESHGTATVFRFTADSIRRALDAGWTAAELHAFVLAVSRTPVPQPLSYLIDDVVRQFGRLRIGLASSFIRSDDDAALVALLGHPRSAQLDLRRVAPTVVVSGLPIDLLLARLRELGVSAVLEGPDGVVQVGAPDALRARPRRSRKGADPARGAARQATQVVHAVRSLREGDEAQRNRPATASAPGGGVLSALRDAIERGGTVLIGFTDFQGVVSERTVVPLEVEGGQLRARDVEASADDLDAERRYAVHRISRVVPVG